MALDWSKYPDFTEDEFSHGGPEMDSGFMSRLQTARSICRELTKAAGFNEIPFRINSGSRSRERNRQVGGKPDSTHLYGRACDIAYTSSRECFFIAKSLLLAGFTRIGIAKNFIHVDIGEDFDFPDKAPNVLYLY